jgi:ectoine hydroxylase-related dioxygenase (phytanoyl-CoA dioxygenase family)
MDHIKVTQEDKDVFNRDGYWISPKLLTDEEIARLRAAHERIWAGDWDREGMPLYHNYIPSTQDSPKLRKLDNGWWINDTVHEFVTNPLLGELAADLLGEDSIRLWHDQVIYKPGLNGQVSSVGNVGWHQDYGYWESSNRTNMVTVWIALQDTDLTNGGMRTILSSHKWGLIKDSNTFFEQNLDILRDKFATDNREWVEEPCIMKAGQASFHHALTFHGSGPNHTADPRLSIVAHLMPGNTAYQEGEQRHPNVKLLGPRPYNGQKFDNEFFPLLFSRA